MGAPLGTLTLPAGLATVGYHPGAVSQSVVFRRLVASTIVVWAAAAVVYGSLRLIYGDRPAYVHVRWAPGVDSAGREQRERLYHLTRGEFKEQRTWAYWLTDASRGNIRALVEDSAVEDTHQIHRTAFRPWRTAPRGAYLGPGPSWIGAMMEVAAVFFAALGFIPLGLAALERVGAPAPLRPTLERLTWVFTAPAAALPLVVRRAWEWLEARVPLASAEAVAVFRILFGAALLVFFVTHAVTAEWIQVAVPRSDVQRMALRAYEAAPFVADWLLPWIVFWTALFVAGAMARTSFAMLTVGAVAWVLLYTCHVGGHSVQVLPVAMLCLVWSRWGDAWSVDAWFRRRAAAASTAAKPPSARHPQTRIYGYTMWTPGLVLGTSYAAAAFAKLRESGIAWVTNGTVKYHFLSDSPQATVDWGLQIAQHHGLAVLMSFGAIALEALVIVGVCSVRYRYRLAAGLAAMGLLIGFALFQGLFWPAWAILLLSFLPWHLIRPADPAGDVVSGSSGMGTASGFLAAGASTKAFSPRPAFIQMVVVLLLVGQQIFATSFRVEAAPLLSAFDMYSTTYASPAEYESKAGLTYWIVADFADGTSDSCKVARQDAEGIARARVVSVAITQYARTIGNCFGSGRRVLTLAIEGRRRRIDWQRWQFLNEVSVRIAGPIPISVVD